ncbi:DHA2 family efflux MFS transporter permease subunit [Actinomadura alba]|uniref:DHA2 family efflux MFS transporter permease subunit n=1 Tax=Actinomadura alba TaxID=406431 RepID=A0ABR7LRR8_9ACTN|nr:DHA2 family efflux MFS transporter permease subunit [Actinomadura alba]MBC6467373.1 DHA2 family efflux MFS transporter permease subunit [Actinomadura alba]
MTKMQGDRIDPALRRLIGVILLGGIMGILDGTMVAVGADILAEKFDTSLSAISWVSTGYLLALTITIPITTWAVDRFGGRRLWLFGLALFLGGSLASGLAWNVGSLIVFRVIQGIGAGTIDPLVLTLLARAAGPRRAGRVMGLMAGVLSFGPVLGPVVGGIVLQTLGWRWMFLINLPIGLVAFLGALRVMRGDPPREERPATRLDIIGVALITPGFASLVLALSQAGDRAAFTVLPVLAPLAAGIVLMIGYAARALRVRRTPPLIDLRLFTRPSFAASVTVMALTGLAMYSILFVVPLYYQQAHGHGALAAGLLVAPFGVSAAIAAPLAGRLSERFGARSVVRAGAFMAAIAALAFTRIGAQTDEVWPTLAALATGLGLGLVGAPTMGSMYRTLPAPLVPQGSSVLYMLNQLGASIGIAVVALIVQTAGDADAMRGFHGVFWFVTAAILVILAGTVLLPGRPEPPPAAGTSGNGTAAAQEQLALPGN